jgi:hypothetical protein
MDAVAEDVEPDALKIAPELLTSPVAVALVAALNAELSALYPEPGATHFSLDPGEVAPDAGVFLVAAGQVDQLGAARCVTFAKLVSSASSARESENSSACTSRRR